MSQLDDAIQSLQSTSKRIVEIVSNLPTETVRWKFSAEKWSIQEILVHVEELIPYWSQEICRVVADPTVQWGRSHSDDARLAAVAKASERETTEVLAGIEAAAQRAVNALGALDDEDLKIESPSRNPRFGTKPMGFVLEDLLVEHVHNHLGQIQRNIEQFAKANARL